jgi:pyruvate kinase
VTLTTDESKKQSGTADCIFVDYKNIVKVVELGGTIYVDDGLISLTVKEKVSEYNFCIYFVRYLELLGIIRIPCYRK